MQKKIFILFLVSIQLLLQSCCWTCNNQNFIEPVTIYKPVKMDRIAFEASIKLIPNQNITKSGKIYIKDNLMLLNDVNKGFHVYNYSDAENPIKIAFIEIPGATDISIRNSTIYINQAVDLVTLNYDLSTNSISVLNRNKKIFPQKRSPDGYIGSYGENEIIVDWILN